MERKYRLAYVLITLLLLGIFVVTHWSVPAPSEELNCTGTLKKNAFLPDGSEAVIDASIYVLIRKGNEGVVNYNGAVTHNGVRYRVRRMSNFNYSHEQGSSVYGFIWQDMNLSGDDNLPQELNFMIQPQVKETFLSFRKLEGNTIAIERDGFPLLACATK